MLSIGSSLTSQWASASGRPLKGVGCTWAGLWQALELGEQLTAGQVEFVHVRCARSWLVCLLDFWFSESQLLSHPVSRDYFGALHCLSCFTEGRFLTWPLTQRLAPNWCSSVKHEEQQGRAKHLLYLGKTGTGVGRSEILCTLWLNISAGAKGRWNKRER